MQRVMFQLKTATRSLNKLIDSNESKSLDAEMVKLVDTLA